MRQGFTKLEGKCGSSNCFDGVYVKGDTVYINEVKPLNADGSIKLSGPSGNMQTQMSRQWIESGIQRLQQGTAEQQAVAVKIRAALDGGTLTKVVTGVDSKGMVVVKLN